MKKDPAAEADEIGNRDDDGFAAVRLAVERVGERAWRNAVVAGEGVRARVQTPGGDVVRSFRPFPDGWRGLMVSRDPEGSEFRALPSLDFCGSEFYAAAVR